MTRAIVLLASFVAVLATVAPAEAQRENYGLDLSATVHEAHRDSRRVALETEELALDGGEGALAPVTAPSGGDYVLPILGVVLGGAMVVGGAVVLLGGAVVMAVQRARGNDTAGAAIAMGIAGGGLAVGATVLTSSIVGLVGLRRRARAASEAETYGFSIVPSDDGVLASVSGTF